MISARTAERMSGRRARVGANMNGRGGMNSRAPGTRLEWNGPPRRAVVLPGPARTMSGGADSGQFCDGVFSAKYSWLSALSSARAGSLAARLLAAL